VSEWISVEDRLPEEKVVLAYTKSGDQVLAFLKRPWYQYMLLTMYWEKLSHWYSVEIIYEASGKISFAEYKPLGVRREVTHWMPLPNPPEDSK
jgi:uncharacterized protein DUF551